MSSFENQFIWYDLMTTDTAAAQEFYGAVVGWTMVLSPLTDRGYTILHAGEIPMGGLMKLPDEALQHGARPGWIGYIAVVDVDAKVAQITGAGGMLHRAAEDIPSVGRFAVVADPQGAAFVLFHGTGKMPDRPAEVTPGLVNWNELHAADGAAAFEFYAAQFGWTKDQAIEMGPMGIYQLFAAGGPAIGGMMTRMDPSMPPHWNYYINVADINAAAERVKVAGGQVVHGPVQVPGGSWVLNALDPQGAFFALVAPQ
jgi:predicted enzyme related to lactoylglutathione lyase